MQLIVRHIGKIVCNDMSRLSVISKFDRGGLAFTGRTPLSVLCAADFPASPLGRSRGGGSVGHSGHIF